MAEGDSPEITSIREQDLRGITGTKGGGSVEQRQQRLAQLRERANQTSLGTQLKSSESAVNSENTVISEENGLNSTTSEYQRSVLTPPALEPISTNLPQDLETINQAQNAAASERSPEIKIIPPDQIPPEALVQVLASVNQEYRD